MENIQQYLEMVGQWAVTTGFRVMIVVVLLTVGMRGVDLLVEKLFGTIFQKIKKRDGEFEKRTNTLTGIIKASLRVVIAGIGIMTLLGILGIEIGPVLAAAGVIGLAVGFGAQKLVEDVISGFFILLEDQIRVGDVVNIAGVGGLVEKVDLRMIVLRDLSGNVHFVRNSKIDVVTNMTKDFSFFVFDIGVAYRENVDEVISVVRQIDEGMRQDPDFKGDILQPIEILGLDKFGDSAMIIKARTKTLPIKQWAVGREFNRRLKMAFDERNIEFPFPHVRLYMGQDKTGASPAMNVSLREPLKSGVKTGL